MQAELLIHCGQDGQYLGRVKIDTADMPDDLQQNINKVILAHRKDCQYYRDSVVKEALRQK